MREKMTGTSKVSLPETTRWNKQRIEDEGQGGKTDLQGIQTIWGEGIHGLLLVDLLRLLEITCRCGSCP